MLINVLEYLERSGRALFRESKDGVWSPKYEAVLWSPAVCLRHDKLPILRVRIHLADSRGK